MSQRHSEYPRRPNDDYATPPGVAQVIAPCLRQHATHLWDPACGAGQLVQALSAEGFQVIGTADDFLVRTGLAHDRIDCIVTNPPYGIGGRLSRATPEAQPVVFSNAVAEAADYVRKGLGRIDAIDELADMAASIGWGDVDRAQAIIAETFKKIDGTGVAEVVSEERSDFNLNRKKRDGEETSAAVSLDDFFAYMPQHNYIFTPARELWPAASINARVGPVIGPDGKSMPAAKWLDANAAVEQMTWAPGKPELIRDKLIATVDGSIGPGVRYLISTARP